MAKLRSKRFHTLTKMGKGAKKYSMASVQAKASWGLQLLEVPPGLARKLRADLARAAGGGTAAGRCPITMVAYHFGLSKDPEVRTKMEQVKLFLTALQGSPELAQLLDRSWGHYKAILDTAKSVWGRARGPAQSLMAALGSSGWKLHTRTISPEGQHYKIVKGEPPAPFLSLIQHFEEKRFWEALRIGLTLAPSRKQSTHSTEQESGQQQAPWGRWPWGPLGRLLGGLLQVTLTAPPALCALKDKWETKGMSCGPASRLPPEKIW